MKFTTNKREKIVETAYQVHIMSSMIPCYHLHTVDLCGSYTLKDPIICTLADYAPHLTQINLKKCALLTDVSVLKLVTQCVSLTLINISYCKAITDNAIAAIIENCANVKHINYQECISIINGTQHVRNILKKCAKIKKIHWTSFKTEVLAQADLGKLKRQHPFIELNCDNQAGRQSNYGEKIVC